MCARIVCAFAFAIALSNVASADEASLRKMLQEYGRAFNAKDTAAISAMWSDKAIYVDREIGDRLEGRKAIVSDIEQSFKDRPNGKLTAAIDSIRMIKADVACVHGKTTFVTPEEEPVETKFSLILIKEGDKWVIDSADEQSVHPPASSRAALRELEWLIGTWKEESDGVLVESTFRWSPSESFLIRSFVATSEDDVVEQGTQVIGWDPAARQIRSWTFNGDGSFGEGRWSKNGQDWMIKASQTLADGQAASGTYVVTRVDADSISIQLIGHEVAGEPKPTRPAVTMNRTKVVEVSSTSAPETDAKTSEGKKQ